MALPSAYLVSTARLPAFFKAIQNAQAPERFTQAFLESLDFKSTNDRLVIGLLKALRFLDDSGKPTSLYFEFLDPTQSARVLAEAIRNTYADLFAVNKNAQNLTKTELLGKLKTLAQGQYSENILDRMALTFLALTKEADFNAVLPARRSDEIEQGSGDTVRAAPAPDDNGVSSGSKLRIDGFIYQIYLQLPESRDQAVYDALFRSLKEHLL